MLTPIFSSPFIIVLQFFKPTGAKFPSINILKHLPKKISLFETIIVSCNDELVDLFLKKQINFWSINVILKKGRSGELYWISSGKKTWFYEFAKILEKNTNCKVVYPKTPAYTKKVDVGNFIVNNSKLRKLGWSPKISVDVGIRKTLDYFQSN